LKRFWAKIKKKDKTVRNLSLWEGIFVKTKKLRGFLAKLREQVGLTGIDSGWVL
jgi:hypothetical protein